MAQGMIRPGGDNHEPDRLTARYVLRDHLAQLASIHSKRWTQTPDRAQAARDLLNGDLVAPIPEAFGKSGIDIGAFRVDLPDKYLTAYHQRNVLSKAEPRVKRWPRGDSQAAKLESTKIEQIVQAVMDDRFPWREAADVILNEGVALAITLHDTAAMAQTPSLYEADGKTVRARYARNAAGKAKAEAPKDWRVSLKASAKEHERDKRELASRRIPLQMEVLGPRSIIPVFGPGLCLDAVLVERYWTTTEVLRRKWLWEGMDDHLSPDGSAVDGYTDDSHGGVGQIKVVELYAVDYQDDGPHPYVAYSIGSKKVYKRDGADIVDSLIDLRKEYGLTRLPAVLKWGCHWATAEYDKRAMPFPIPFAQSQRAVDAILTGIVVQTWWRGFPTLIESPPKDGGDFGRLAETDDDDEVEIAPMTIIRTRGEIKELGAGRVSDDAYRAIEIMRGTNQEVGPPSAAAGSGGESGFQISLSRAFADDAMDDVRDGLLELYAETASIALESLSGIAEKYGPVPVQRITPVPLATRRSGTQTRQILELSHDLVDGYYDLDAEYPPQPNLAKGQQWAEWASLPNPLILREEFRSEIIGDEHPEVFEARLMAQMAKQTPEALQRLLQLAAQLAGDADEQAQLESLANQQAVQGADGGVYPASMTVGLEAAGVPQVQQGQMPVPLTGAGGLPSPGGSALGGAIGGPVAAINSAAAAGGMVPPDMPLGSV